jgi:hypothetical protein
MNDQFNPSRIIPFFLSFICLLNFSGCGQEQGRNKSSGINQNLHIAAYIWPSCHDEPRSREILWDKGIGEWEIIQSASPRFEGHYQPRVPLWGYEMDDDPVAMEKKIEAATDHGVNVFIFDWYWYDGGPFLESTLNNGFLKAANKDKMDFYLMWANHDVPGNMWNHFRYKTDSLIWEGTIDQDNYKIIVDRIIKNYFSQPNYFRIDGEPVFSIFSLQNLAKSFNGLDGALEALDYFRDEVIEAGYPGLHLQLVGWGGGESPYLLGNEYNEGLDVQGIVERLGANSVTTYNWTGSGLEEDYLLWAENAMTARHRWDSTLDVPYIPVVSIGWDNTPRYPEFGKDRVVHIHNTPESFGAYMQKTVDFVKERPEQPPMIIINAWNEWVEGSYLEPDMLWGYGYLEAVRKVIKGE